MEPAEARAANPALRGDLEGALHCGEDAVVEPRLALGALRDHLATEAADRYRFHPRRRVVAVGPPNLVDTTGARWEADVAVLATGAAYDHLPGTGSLASRLRRVRLQMLETAPFAGPSRPRSPTPTRCVTTRPTSRRRWRSWGSNATAAAHHLQLLAGAAPDGGLTIGDTHAYGEPFDFALCEDPTVEPLARAERILGAELPRCGGAGRASTRSAPTAPCVCGRRSARGCGW